MVDKRSKGNYNDNKGNRKRGEKMERVHFDENVNYEFYKGKDIRNRTYGEDIENMFAPVKTLPRPVWFEGQTVFQITPQRIVWKNHTYVRTAEFSTNTPVVEENSKKFMKRFSLSKHMFKCRVKEIAKAGLFYIPIIILILILLR